MAFFADKVALEQSFCRAFGLSLLIAIPALFLYHLPTTFEVCDSPDQAAHYYTVGPKLRASSLTRHVTGLEVKAVILNNEILNPLRSAEKEGDIYQEKMRRKLMDDVSRTS
jgi:hypothetical protein